MGSRAPVHVRSLLDDWTKVRYPGLPVFNKFDGTSNLGENE